MKLLSLLTAFLFAVAAIFAAPVGESEGLAPRGDTPVYDVTTQVIIVTVYIVTETEYLYEVMCDYDKWQITCDYEVHHACGDPNLICRHSTRLW